MPVNETVSVSFDIRVSIHGTKEFVHPTHFSAVEIDFPLEGGDSLRKNVVFLGFMYIRYIMYIRYP